MSQPVSPRINDAQIISVAPDFVSNSRSEESDVEIEEVNREQLDSSQAQAANLLKKFNSLDENTQAEALALGAKIIQIQANTLNVIEEQTKEMHASLDVIGQVLRSWDAPGGPLDPVRLKEEDEQIQRDEEEIEQQKKVTEQQKKDIEEQKKTREEQKKTREEQKKNWEEQKKTLEQIEERRQKEQEARQARWDRFRYIIGLAWLYDGAQSAKNIAYDNRKTIIKIGLVAGAVFFLHIATNNYPAIPHHKAFLLWPPCFEVTALTGYHILIKERIPTYLEPSFKE